MYGAEPNAYLHPKLLENMTKAGIGKGKYATLECGDQPGSLLPALKRAGLIPSAKQSLPEDGIFDLVIAIKSMCSIPQNQLAVTIAVVQGMLKPGGELPFSEHVENHADIITKIFVRFVNLIWPSIIGGCNLGGKLDRVVAGMGGGRVEILSPRQSIRGRNLSDMSGILPGRRYMDIDSMAKIPRRGTSPLSTHEHPNLDAAPVCEY